MSTSMREALDAAFKKQEEVGGPDPDAEESVRDSGEEEEEPLEEEPKVEEKEDDDGDSPDEGDEKESDEGHQEEEPGKGKDTDKSSKPEADKSGGKDGDDKKADGELKAPVSWKPAAREHWAKLPKEAKDEILRREKEIEKGLHQASGYRKVADEYFRVVKPFEQMIRAQNSTPAQAITNLMTTAARLTMGTKAQKAQVVYEIMKNYDVDVETLDTILAGKTPKGGPSDEVAKLLDERLKPVTDFISGVQNSRRQAEEKTDEELAKELTDFSEDPKNEFFNDVVDDMADLMDLAGKRGQKISLKVAYDRACRLNPDVSKILDQREAARRGQLDQENLRKKRTAASSVRGARGEEDGRRPESNDVRSAVAQAWADAEEAR